jgi:hypothetical protein
MARARDRDHRRLERGVVKRVLMIAYHYPPQTGSSGVQRTQKFARYLGEFGWEASVLTAHARAYPGARRPPQEDAGPVSVHRAFALDSSRHLAFRGRYLQISALPDRWVSWWLGALPLGLRLLREQQFDVIWSTYPIATAHMIANSLQQRTGIPWIADFRDPMTEPGFPPDPQVHRAHARVERNAMAHCTRAVFTTPGTRDAYLRNFPQAGPQRFSVIENGHDEADFSAALHGLEKAPSKPSEDRRFVLLHSGIVYPSERDPRPLFEALALMRSAALITPLNFQLVLRASAHEATLQGMIAGMGIADIVTLQPPIPYRAALAEMLAADGLLVLQASNCNNQIPAKLYEYVRAGRPILALTDPAGDTAAAMRKMGLDSIAPLDSCALIRVALMGFMAQVRQQRWRAVPEALVQANSRRNRTAELARLLDEVVDRK